jgi:beta-glucanase (GH16 family)
MAVGDTINTGTLALTFDDEFNSFNSSPDGSTGSWRTSLKNGDRTLPPNGEEEYYSDSSVGVNPFSVQNGVLDIQATPGTNALNLPYNSGAITTEDSFNQLYGYFEIDAQLPAGQGLWPAFWMIPADGSWPPELDAFEVLGNDPSDLYFSTHSAVQASETVSIAVPDTSAGFNLYGVMWGPQTVALYINNVEVASMPTPPDMDIPMYLEANLAVGGIWPGDPNASTVFPANMLVNYIRAYAYPGTIGGTVYDTSPSQNVATAAPPVVTLPATLQTTTGYTVALGNVSVASNWPGGFFTITVSDNYGLLETAATSDVFTSGEGTTTLTLTGNLAPLNAALATLTYEGQTPGTEYAWIEATDPQGMVSYTPFVATDIAASDAPVITAPASIGIAAATTQALSGLSVTDSAAGAYTVTVSDGTGRLNVTATSDLTVTGAGSTTLELTGSLAAVNAGLASLTYMAGAGTGSDLVALTATDATGAQGTAEEAVTVSAAISTAGAGGPAVIMPATLAVTPESTETLTGISIADTASGAYTVIVSDGAGSLNAAAAPGVIATGGGTDALTLTGTAAAINADLASLTYQAGPSTGTDWLWVTAYNDQNQDTASHAVVSVANETPLCFLAGTHIATPTGEVKVEALRIGDLVITLHAGPRLVKWIGRRRYAASLVAGNHNMLPICILAGALADGVPARDLWVSPGHAVHLDGALVPAARLINGVTIIQGTVAETLAYYHIELETHELLMAEGCAVESFFDENFRDQFENVAEYQALYPGAQAPGAMCLPRLEDGFMLLAIQRRIADRAGIQTVDPIHGPLRGFIDQTGPARLTGWAQCADQPEEPVCLDILAGGQRIARLLANRYRADLRRAGLGSGCHAFELPLPPELPGPITIRRAADGAPLGGG